MSDYNDNLLPDPCLRMDTHFGDEYESVEFGDGTGYVRAEPTLARLGALYVELDALQAENAKLRLLVEAMGVYERMDTDADPLRALEIRDAIKQLAGELGIEVPK